MDIQRQIDVFDRVDEKLIQEIPINDFNLEMMSQIFELYEKDPLMYMQYEIEEIHKGHFPGVDFDFNKYVYFLACYQK